MHSAPSPFEEPPQDLKNAFRKYRKMDKRDIDSDPSILDLELPCCAGLKVSLQEPPVEVFESFLKSSSSEDLSHISVYQSTDVPGLLILPSLLPPTLQRELLSRLMHRDLLNPAHQTNLHLHYNVQYPGNGSSFFSLPPSTIVADPKDPNMHRPLSVEQVLQKKLRWMTLGGQYDWTNKVYPNEKSPRFPQDLSELVQGLLPEIEPQAAIINFYSLGDTLSLHRDVAEEVDKSLVSISIGCDCIFLAGLNDKKAQEVQSPSRYVVVRLRSGDALYMTGESRLAWHCVPKIVPGTCPAYLAEWPSSYPSWQHFMDNKRVNLNVRQMS